MTQLTFANQCALVTGASSGLGADFARELAKHGANLILVARNGDALTEVADELQQQHDIHVDCLPMDLSQEDAPASLHQRVAEMERQVDILVNNAGFGLHGHFLDIEWAQERAMLQLNIVALVHLTRLFAADMVQRGYGRILQVASVGAYQPTPTYASYSATKTFVLFHGEALHHELKGTGVQVSVVSPGVTATRFFRVAGQEPTLYQRLFMMPSHRVATVGVRALQRGKASVVVGVRNKIMAFSVRFMPRRAATAIASALMRWG